MTVTQSPSSIASDAEDHAGELSQLAQLANDLAIPYYPTLNALAPCLEFIERIPISFARQRRTMAFVDNGQMNTEHDALLVALPGIDEWPQLDVVCRLLGKTVHPILAPEAEITKAINVAYKLRSGAAESAIESLGNGHVSPRGVATISREDLLDVSGRAPVVELVNSILLEAVKQGSSDVHVQPYEDQLVVRLRIDGILFDAFKLPKEIQSEVSSRMKVIGNMDIAEKRLPQDGRATVKVGDIAVDLRIASLPTSFGERIVIRVLDKSARVYSLGELGMAAGTLSAFQQMIRVEHGLILVTGPTGSGKSTTLYAALKEIDSKDRNVVTLEDPIEYELPGISQTQVNERKGLTFACGLRSVLRQDPDIIMVGEIRDEETAAMAIQSALTGHLVFSTLHTNDAASAVTRLLDLGIEPYLVASSVIGVMAQRLVRRVCPDCCSPLAIDEPDLSEVRAAIANNMRSSWAARLGKGCANCRQTGYRGRVGLYELIAVDHPIRELIHARGNAAQIASQARHAGAGFLRDDGLRKIASGQTTIEEIRRVTAAHDDTSIPDPTPPATTGSA